MSVLHIGLEHDYRGTREKSINVYNREMEILAKEKLEFYLSCFLIGAQPYSYFQYGWGWELSDGSLVDFPELLKSLGVPKEPCKRINTEGWEFVREFEYISVWVNESRKSSITWK